jgi:hypothetical protein
MLDGCFLRCVGRIKGKLAISSFQKLLSEYIEKKKRNISTDVSVLCKVGPCPHSLARPRFADGGTASSYGG